MIRPRTTFVLLGYCIGASLQRLVDGHTLGWLGWSGVAAVVLAAVLIWRTDHHRRQDSVR